MKLSPFFVQENSGRILDSLLPLLSIHCKIFWLLPRPYLEGDHVYLLSQLVTDLDSCCPHSALWFLIAHLIGAGRGAETSRPRARPDCVSVA